MRVAIEKDWPIIQAHMNDHVKRFPAGMNPNMPGYWDGVWLMSTNEACSMCWKESERDVHMCLVWNATVKSSAGAKELVEFAKRYSKKPVYFTTYAGVSAGTERAFLKWGFERKHADKEWVTYEYAA